MQKYLLIACGGAFGSVARVWATAEIEARFGSAFPYGTFAVNLAACTIIGFLLALAVKHGSANSPWRFLVAIGFIGAFSTFSTFAWELFSKLSSGAFLLASLYAAASLLLGLLAIWGGGRLAKAIA